LIHVRKYLESDWPVIWPMLQSIFRAGETYTFAPDCTEAEIHRARVETPSATFVACDSEGRILGTYFTFVMFKQLAQGLPRSP
jgi:hypothetical protein